MKATMAMLFVCSMVIGCSGALGNFFDDSPQVVTQIVDSIDGEPEWSTDEGVCGAVDAGPCDADALCSFVCSDEFDFMACISTVAKSLPIDLPKGENCVDRCNMTMFVYESLSAPPNYNCLGKAKNCAAVAHCLGVK